MVDDQPILTKNGFTKENGAGAQKLDCSWCRLRY